MRGDHASAYRCLLASVGLPPRARGSPQPARARRTSRGPTPACAGITLRASSSTCAVRAYPRVRGDHPEPANLVPNSLGLPPRARGSRRASRAVAEQHRPTPACAGITSSRAPGRHPARAYPRVRGDHRTAVAAQHQHLGLPPRARGSRAPPPLTAQAARPTPACAGITLSFKRFTRPATAYPRVRGDHISISTATMYAGGLPPRARGSRVPSGDSRR